MTRFISIAFSEGGVENVEVPACDVVASPVVILATRRCDDAGILPEEADLWSIITNACGVSFVEAFGAPGRISLLIGVAQFILQLFDGILHLFNLTAGGRGANEGQERKDGKHENYELIPNLVEGWNRAALRLRFTICDWGWFALADFIERKIADEHYSPAAIIMEIQKQGLEFDTTICEKTIYNYVNSIRGGSRGTGRWTL